MNIQILDPVRLLQRRFRVKSLVFFALLLAYVALSFGFFFKWMDPSLDGRTDQHIAADSISYLYFADQLRGGEPDPFVLASLSGFPNNLWAPVALALLLKSTLVMALANYGMLFLTVYFFRRTFSFSIQTFLSLLLLNATTFVSLLSVNKEIVDLLVVAGFFYACRRRLKVLMLLVFVIAIVNRFEIAMVMFSFLAFTMDLPRFKRHRGLKLVLLILALNFAIPALVMKAFSNRVEEASSGGLVIWLNSLEMHYLYALAMVPKVAQNLFGTFLNPSAWQALLNPSDIANSYIVFLNNLATLIVCAMLLPKRRAFALDSDLIYFAMIGCSLMAASPVIQPRYFYFVYALLCLRAAELAENTAPAVLKDRVAPVLANG